MAYDNFWGINECLQDNIDSTEEICNIMDQQCKYLYNDTQGKVFAVFSEITPEYSFTAMTQAMSKLVKNISCIAKNQEGNDDNPSDELIDAGNMYYNKKFEFTIYTDKYRFRIFEVQITPVYPIDIIIDGGICKNIGNELERIAKPTEKDNCFTVMDQDSFCTLLKKILQDKKVRYIISKLQKSASEKDEKEHLTDKLIICEGRTDEVILRAIANRNGSDVRIVTTEQKYNVPDSFAVLRKRDKNSQILLVVDSDGDEDSTRREIVEKLGEKGYELVIINNCIEDWFAPNVAGFSKLKLMQTIDSIVEELDFEEESKKHESFAQVLAFLNR